MARIPKRLVADRLRWNRWLGWGLFALGVLGAVALISYHGRDASFFFQKISASASTKNWLGRVGATLGETLLQTFGAAAFLACWVALLVGWQRWRDPERSLLGRGVAWSVALLAIATLLDLAFGHIAFRESGPLAAGGFLGRGLAGVATSAFSVGAWAVASICLALAMVALAWQSFSRSWQISAVAAGRQRVRAQERWQDWRAKRATPAQPASEIRKPQPQKPARATAQPEAPGEAKPPSIELASPAADTPAPKVSASPQSKRQPITPKPAQQQSLPIEKGARGYSPPPLDLLNDPEPQTIESEQELLERAQQITEKLREFSVGGAVVAVHPGPVVTTFEFKPDAGVKYSKITSMTDDLSLALRAESVRIDRMPGRATVGIEVPNRRQETIFPKDLISSKAFRDSKSKLTLALGKDITGGVFVAELDRMPHLLIAGATGAGKSVGLNGMIASLLYKATPEHLRFIMIDTKMIELGIYADIPHLLVPVVTEPKKAAAALKWAVREMETRYRKLAAVGVRNLAQFNALVESEPDKTVDDPKTGEAAQIEKLPYIVIVIDEMADLMMVSSSEVEEAIMRLAQMARAVGIHLILATQRPSVDVITGTIKANFPSRIAFRVSQRVDSRTIIDQQGAEHLLGRGDMLFLATGASRVVRLHGGFITESELNRITSFLKKSAEPVYDESVLQDEDEVRGATGDPIERDEMYADAVRTVIQEGKCSITLIQRRLQLGYARAARIVDIMEQQGVVSPGEGSKPREILVGPEILETLDGGPTALNR